MAIKEEASSVVAIAIAPLPWGSYKKANATTKATSRNYLSALCLLVLVGRVVCNRVEAPRRLWNTAAAASPIEQLQKKGESSLSSHKVLPVIIKEESQINCESNWGKSEKLTVWNWKSDSVIGSLHCAMREWWLYKTEKERERERERGA